MGGGGVSTQADTKTNPNHGGSYIDSPGSIKNKKVKINPINKKDDKCFSYAVKVVLNHEEIKNDRQIIKIKPFLTCLCFKT